MYVFPFENRIHFLYFLQESLNKHPIFALSPNSAVIQTKHDSLEWLQCFQLPKSENSHIFKEIANCDSDILTFDFHYLKIGDQYVSQK